jgi:predicted RNase H-like nuclease
VQGAKLHGATFAPELPKVYETFLEIISERPAFEIVVVNAPVGFLDTPEDGPRTCDVQARALLGFRGAVIHNAPSRSVLRGEVAWVDTGLDAITATLLGRYREVAAEMSPFRQRTIYEGNPELSFFQLNQDVSMQRSKRAEEGQEERRKVLESHIPGIDKALDVEINGVSEKHVFDALSLLWTARRVFGHAARRMPIEPEWDSDGLRMELVY